MVTVADWRQLLESMSRVGRLVHLAARYDAVDEQQIAARLMGIRKVAYEDELSIQAARAGCSGRRGRLSNPAILAELQTISNRDAASIVNTYNRDLAGAISAIRVQTPTANRNTYAKRLREWHDKRAQWKNPQVVQYAVNQARSKAQSDFFQKNHKAGEGEFGRIVPRVAVCPVCRGWIKRGRIPMRVIMNNPPPYHQNCPHVVETSPAQRTYEECQLLWLGSE